MLMLSINYRKLINSFNEARTGGRPGMTIRLRASVAQRASSARAGPALSDGIEASTTAGPGGSRSTSSSRCSSCTCLHGV